MMDLLGSWVSAGLPHAVFFCFIAPASGAHLLCLPLGLCKCWFPLGCSLPLSPNCPSRLSIHITFSGPPLLTGIPREYPACSLLLPICVPSQD